MMKKKIKLTITADPDAGFLHRVLLVFSRRKLSLSRCHFEGPALRNELFCQLELKVSEEVLAKLIKQIENILEVKNVTFDIIQPEVISSYRYQGAKEKDFDIVN